MVDSLLFPDTISFLRFEYPSSLERNVQNRLAELVKSLISQTSLDNTLFNVECIYNPITDKIYIVEINPRISSQFADLFERVDGFNTYEILLDIALNQKPHFCRGQGIFNIAASCVLRCFEDQLVLKVPSVNNINRLTKMFPDMYFERYAEVGKMLSNERQDSKSFRYALIHLGAFDREDLLNRLDICTQLLDFQFKTVS